ncbi:MAG: hypothetical protein KKH04_02880 [Proteobacteria bacterium]|nr:hypothetical protein [Pseudomonadota bacterium]
MQKNIVRPVPSLLDRLKWAGMFLTVIALPFSATGKEIGIFFGLLIFLIQIFRHEVEVRLSIVHYGLFLLLSSAMVSSWFAADTLKSMDGFNNILFYAIPF